MKCKKHPKYKGVSKPNRDCPKCWKIYEKKNPDGDTYQNYIHKCTTHKKYTGKNKPYNECKGCWDYYNWKNNKHESLIQLQYNKKKRNLKKSKITNKKIFRDQSKLLQKNFIKKDAYYFDWYSDYDPVDNPYKSIISTAISNYIFYKSITKYMLFKFFSEIHKLDNTVFGEIWLSILKRVLDKENFEINNNGYISEPHAFSSYAIDEYKKFIEIKYFNKKQYDFKNYNLEIL